MKTSAWAMAVLIAATACACDPRSAAQTQVGSQAVTVASSDPRRWQGYLAAADSAERIADPVQRCLAYPDLPGNAWVDGAAKARCPLLREATPTIEELAKTLDAPDGAAQLDRLYAGILDAHYRDPDRRDGIFTAYRAFATSDESRRIAEAWHAQSPDSPFARMALADELIAAASNARGGEWISETPQPALQTMHRLLDQAVPLLDSALASEPRLSPACASLIAVGKLASNDALRDRAIEHCRRVDPLSWNVEFEWQLALDPRWGGSFEAIDRSVETIRPLVDRNPALGGMLARGVGMHAYLHARFGEGSKAQRLQQAAPMLEEASRLAPDPMFIAEAGIAARDRGDLPMALAYLSQAIRLANENARFYSVRAKVRSKLDDPERAAADARRAIEIEDSGEDQATLASALVKLGQIDGARDAYRKAMQDRRLRPWAFKRWCETWILHTLVRGEALACTQGLVTEFPRDAESWFMRAWVLGELKDARSGEAAARFHDLFDASDPRQRQMKSELARLRGGGE